MPTTRDAINQKVSVGDYVVSINETSFSPFNNFNGFHYSLSIFKVEKIDNITYHSLIHAIDGHLCDRSSRGMYKVDPKYVFLMQMLQEKVKSSDVCDAIGQK